MRCIPSDEAHLIKEAVGPCSPYPWGRAESPGPFATPRGRVRQAWVAPPLEPFRLPAPGHLPVLPWETSETMASPAVPIPQHRGRLAPATVALPSLPRLLPRRDDVLQAPPGVPWRQRFAPVEGLGGPCPSTRRLPSRTTAPQDTAVLGAVDGALLRLPLALQALGNAPTAPSQAPCPGAPTPHGARASGGGAVASVPSALPLLLPGIQDPMRQDRCKRRALRRTSRWDRAHPRLPASPRAARRG